MFLNHSQNVINTNFFTFLPKRHFLHTHRKAFDVVYVAKMSVRQRKIMSSASVVVKAGTTVPKQAMMQLDMDKVQLSQGQDQLMCGHQSESESFRSSMMEVSVAA